MNITDLSDRINGVKLKKDYVGWDFRMWLLAVLTPANRHTSVSPGPKSGLNNEGSTVSTLFIGIFCGQSISLQSSPTNVFSVFFYQICLVLGSVVAVIIYRVIAREDLFKSRGEAGLLMASVTSTFINTISIMIMGKVNIMS